MGNDKMTFANIKKIKQQMQAMAPPPRQSMSDGEIEALKRELPQMSSSQRANVMRELYSRYPDERDGILGFVAESLKQEPTERAVIDRAQASFNRAQLAKIETDAKNLTRKVMARQARPFVIADDAATIAAVAARRDRELMWLERDRATGIERRMMLQDQQFGNVTDLQRMYREQSAKLAQAFERDVAEYEWVAPDPEDEKEKISADDYNSWNNGFVGMDPGIGRTVAIPRSALIPKVQPKAVPIAPAPGRRKIRLED